MKRMRNLQMFSYLMAGVLLVGLAAAPNLLAQGFAGRGSTSSAAYPDRKGLSGPDLGCSAETFRGTYMYTREQQFLSNLTEVFPDFIDPFTGKTAEQLAGTLSRGVGIAVIDEQGVSFRSFSEDSSIHSVTGQTFTFDLTQFFDIRTEVFPDCTAFTFFLNKETGEEIQRFYWVFGNGMREAFVLEVGPGTPGNPVMSQHFFTFKKIDAFDQELESKVDQNSADLAFIKDLVKRLAAVHGVLRRGDVDK